MTRDRRSILCGCSFILTPALQSQAAYRKMDGELVSASELAFCFEIPGTYIVAEAAVPPVGASLLGNEAYSRASSLLQEACGNG